MLTGLEDTSNMAEILIQEFAAFQYGNCNISVWNFQLFCMDCTSFLYGICNISVWNLTTNFVSINSTDCEVAS